MSLDVETRDGIVILRPVGRLDSSTSPEAERVVAERVEAGCRQMVFDLSDMSYVSSAGLRVILLAGKKLRAQHGKLAIAGMRDSVREIFEMSGFMTLFAMTPDLGAALEKVA